MPTARPHPRSSRPLGGQMSDVMMNRAYSRHASAAARSAGCRRGGSSQQAWKRISPRESTPLPQSAIGRPPSSRPGRCSRAESNQSRSGFVRRSHGGTSSRRCSPASMPRPVMRAGMMRMVGTLGGHPRAQRQLVELADLVAASQQLRVTMHHDAPPLFPGRIDGASLERSRPGRRNMTAPSTMASFTGSTSGRLSWMMPTPPTFGVCATSSYRHSPGSRISRPTSVRGHPRGHRRRSATRSATSASSASSAACPTNLRANRVLGALAADGQRPRGCARLSQEPGVRDHRIRSASLARAPRPRET